MSVVETQLSDLTHVVQELSGRVAVLTDAVDALTDEIQWRNNHARDTGDTVLPFVLTSMPLDPCTDDWQLIRVGRDGLPREAPPQRPVKGTLFD